MFQLFLMLILAHLIADFLLQRNRTIELKKSDLHKGLWRHVMCHFLVSIVSLLIYFSAKTDWTPSLLLKSLIAVVVIAGIHYLIDWWKESLERKHDNVLLSGTIFIVDQLLHVISILVVLLMFGLVSFTYGDWSAAFIKFLFDGIEFQDTTKLLLILSLVITGTEGAGYFLGIVLRNLSPSPTLNKGTYSMMDEKTEITTSYNEKGDEINEVKTIKTEHHYQDSPKNIGRYIGMIERLLIIIFIVQGFPHGLPFLIAIKSLTRFKQFENKQFSEYYLIGSLFSALIAVVIGYAVLRIL